MAVRSDVPPPTLVEPPFEQRLADHYDAFLAYHHLTDHRRSKQLRFGLERLVRPVRATLPDLQVFRFRDMTKVPDAEELWPSIRAAIDRSRWFVLLASARSARSLWVGREIQRRLAVRGIDDIVVVRTGTGEPAGHPGMDLDVEPATPIHPELRDALSRPPRTFDMTWAPADGNQILQDPRYFDLLADLGALLFDLPREEVAARWPR